MARPDTIDQAARMAYDAVLRRTGDDTELADLMERTIHDAYFAGANRALEGAARELEMYGQHSAAHRVRNRKTEEA